jgi:glycosyltransferase involved in cell wall biosynthesis
MTLPITLCCIVRNANGRLRKLIESHRDVVSEVVVIDQYSTDGTYEEALEFADFVVQRRHKGTADSDRNWAFNLASKDYVLYLDDDECLTEEAKALLPSIVEANADAYWFKRDNYVDGIDIREVAGEDLQCRLFKKGAVKFPSRIHKYPEPAVGLKVFYLNCAIRHDRGLEQLTKANRAREAIANKEEKGLQDDFLDKVTNYLTTGLRHSR